MDFRQRALLEFKEFCESSPSKKALVSYLVRPLLPPPSRRNRTMFSNFGIAQNIVQALNELGYAVDIIPYNNVRWRVSENYDLFIGHGGTNYEHIFYQLRNETVKIYFSTGIYWKEFNRREAQRIYDLAVRRGYLLMPDRAILDSEEFANQNADGIICLGNLAAVNTYKQFPRVIGINNGYYPITPCESSEKDFDRGRKHFLFFGGGGNIHKGLDLLIEAFSKTDLHLHICQKIDPQFAKVYQHELGHCANIHLHGFVPMRSTQFMDLARLCNWTIAATCAEGQPGGVIECMAYGLVPILPISANIDVGHFGFQFSDSSIDSITSTICSLSKLPVNECQHRASIMRSILSTEYTADKFTQNFKSAVLEIVAAKQNDRRSK
jgi:glycosyltransferase involved in cell wall biosynthesis